jgi:hypothetical protein
LSERLAVPIGWQMMMQKTVYKSCHIMIEKKMKVKICCLISSPVVVSISDFPRSKYLWPIEDERRLSRSGMQFFNFKVKVVILLMFVSRGYEYFRQFS